jgi:hypothetical protein
MAKKRRKKRRRGGKTSPKPTSPAGGSSSSGGGVMQSLRSGFRRAAGAESSGDRPSTASNVIWTIVLVAAVAFLLYRWYG